jgi:hypothetical protein
LSGSNPQDTDEGSGLSDAQSVPQPHAVGYGAQPLALESLPVSVFGGSVNAAVVLSGGT